ncbi:MAG: bifunctional riboflavin kinase/FAD synthetase [Pelotomaculaceae bacterium]|jgi:riboflavin kinase/FMN adenylyltransferase|uniref:Bifunctional riboflavin kinase/FMN adenylyltransferase n=1 Tax=anaerobic digester metagenome TaxID=1263854 RepID=A0A485M7B4_9ZZZZ|nr:bifunctional riboflavin kinase/FAD synthetase [Bacillota bacterium]HHU85692.1 bifunctional riboflavin kinase/FAD synthetase [Peptococcaceae bacterium]
MYLYQHWHNLKDKHKNLVVGLGNFDGLHLGHQKLISEVVTMADQLRGTTSIFTFHPHPLTVLNPDNSPPLLLSQESKQKLMAGLGIDLLLMVPFDLAFAGMSPTDFIRNVLHGGLGASVVVVGYNYTFGYRGRGTPELLQSLSKTYGYQVKVIPPIMVDGKIVSSTLIRSLLLKGEVAEAAKFLGYYPFVEGLVVTGDQRGSSLLGFPTANIDINDSVLVPANGVYLAKAQIHGESYLGLANIGVKPTFQVKKRNIEVHILDFCQNLYGESVKVSFIHKIREERRFQTPSELIKQIERDILEARVTWSKIKE